jgi:hypothetical protein
MVENKSIKNEMAIIMSNFKSKEDIHDFISNDRKLDLLYSPGSLSYSQWDDPSLIKLSNARYQKNFKRTNEDHQEEWVP